MVIFRRPVDFHCALASRDIVSCELYWILIVLWVVFAVRRRTLGARRFQMSGSLRLITAVRAVMFLLKYYNFLKQEVRQ